jgi:hypothetical protein
VLRWRNAQKATGTQAVMATPSKSRIAKMSGIHNRHPKAASFITWPSVRPSQCSNRLIRAPTAEVRRNLRNAKPVRASVSRMLLLAHRRNILQRPR